ncbi:DNA-binding protein [Actinobaculum sp. 352]|nr:DNA-binding protein [Actinobaculum sp. 352]
MPGTARHRKIRVKPMSSTDPTSLTPVPDPPVLWTADEVASRLRLTRRTISMYAADGQFPGALKIGGHWRFPPASVDGFLNARTPQKTDPYQIAPRTRRAQLAHRKTI